MSPVEYELATHPPGSSPEIRHEILATRPSASSPVADELATHPQGSSPGIQNLYDAPATRLHALSPEKQPVHPGYHAVLPRNLGRGGIPPCRIVLWHNSPHMASCDDLGVKWANTFIAMGNTKPQPPTDELVRLQKLYGMYPDGIHPYGPPVPLQLNLPTHLRKIVA